MQWKADKPQKRNNKIQSIKISMNQPRKLWQPLNFILSQPQICHSNLFDCNYVVMCQLMLKMKSWSSLKCQTSE